MKVSISYSVDLDEVPAEVSRLLASGQKKQEEIFLLYSKIMETLKHGDVTTPIATIDQVRLTMAKLDSSLQDITNILSGFVDAQKRVAAARATANEAESAESEEEE